MKRKPLPNVSITEVWIHYGGEVIERGSNEWQKAKCPMHDDNTPSASVNEDIGRWVCRVCDLRGDVFELIGRMEPGEQLGFRECVAIAEGFTQRGHAPLPPASRGSELLPGGSRNRPGNSNWTPPWSRL